MSISRRNFIRTVVLTSGAVFTGFDRKLSAHPISTTGVRSLDFKRAHEWLRNPKSLPTSSAHPRDVEVVIIGGGPSGLAAAWKLWKEGKQVLLLDNESAPGGTFRGASWKGIDYPVGSTYFVRWNGVYKDFYQDIGVAPIETGEDALYTNEGPIVDWWNPRVIGSLPYPKTDIDAFRKFRDVLVATDTVPRYPLSRARPDDLAKYDLMSAREYVSGFGSDRLTRTLDLYSRSVFGAPLDEVNAYALMNFYAFEFGDSFSIPCYTLPGGLGSIAARAAARLGPEHVTSGALVVSVENAPDGVNVQYLTADGTLERVHARCAIVATQKNIAAAIVHELPSERKEAMRAVQYAPYITVNFCCNAQLFPTRAFDFWFDDPQNRFTDIIDVTSSQDAAATAPKRHADFVYMMSAAQPLAVRKDLEREEYLIQFAQDSATAIEHHIPGSRDKIEEMQVFAWGHSMVIPRAGSHTKLYPAITAPLGNIFFAGADSDLAPSVENALGVAFEAAEGVARKMKG